MSGRSTKNAGRKEGGTTSWEHRGLESLISLRTGDILLYRTNDLGATFNAIVQGSMYSHVSLVVRADSNLLDSLYPDDYQKTKTSTTTDPYNRITATLTTTHNDTIANNINQSNNGGSTSNTSTKLNNCSIGSSDTTYTTNDDNNKGSSNMVFNLLETMYPEDYDGQKNIDDTMMKMICSDIRCGPCTGDETISRQKVATPRTVPQKTSSATSVATTVTNTTTELAIFEVVPNRGVSIFPLIPRLARTIKTIQHLSVRRHTHNNNDDDGGKDGITENASQDFLQFMTDTIGNQLDMLSFNMFRALILNRYKIRLSATSSSDNFFCSEFQKLVAQGLQKLGIIRNDILEANTLIPSTFAESRNNWRMSKTTRMMKESIEDLRRQSIITIIEEEPSPTLFFSTRQNLFNSQRTFLLTSSDEKDDYTHIIKNHDPTITSIMPSSNKNNNNTKKNKTNNANNHFVFGDDKICCTGHGFRKKEILIEYGNPLWIALKNTKEEMRKQQQHVKEAKSQQKHHQNYGFVDTNLNNSNYFGRYKSYYGSTGNNNSAESREDDNSNGNGIGYCDEHDEEWYYQGTVSALVSPETPTSMIPARPTGRRSPARYIITQSLSQ